MVIKAFGKLDLSLPLPLREFEVYFNIEARDGPTAWTSGYPSIQKLLDHLRRYTQSESSREKYLQVLYRFCLWTGHTISELVSMDKNRVESLIQRFIDELATMDRSRSYLNSLIKRLKTFFRVNGYEKLKVASYFLPTRYRKRGEYIPSKSEVFAMADAAGGLRNRAIILVLWSSGLRVSTLCAENYGDVAEELEAGEPYVMIPIYPEMKERVPDSCKGKIPYRTFAFSEAGAALRSYLLDREEKYGQISHEAPLFHSDWTLWPREGWSGKRLGRRGVGLVVKESARLAGIRDWKHVTPHCLRKAFEMVLVSPTVDGGRLDKGTQEFFMGHILPGTQDVYYDKTKIDFHREEYAKLDFSRSGIWKRKTLDKLIDMAKLEGYLRDSWHFVARVNDNRVVVRRSD